MQVEYSSYATKALADYIKNFVPTTPLEELRHRVKQLLDANANPSVIVDGKTLPDILFARDIYNSDRTALVHMLVDKGADFSTHADRLKWVKRYSNCPSTKILFARYPHLLAEEKVIRFCELPANDVAGLQEILSEKSNPVDVNLQIDKISCRTKIYAAIQIGAIKSVELLLQHGARMDVRDADGISPLDLAIHCMKSAENPAVARRMYDLVWQATFEKSSLEDVYHVRLPDEVVCEQPPTATALRIREVFNFSKGVYTQIIDDFANNRQTACVRTFDEVGDIGAIALARTAFRKATSRDVPQQAYYQSKIADKSLPQP